MYCQMACLDFAVGIVVAVWIGPVAYLVVVFVLVACFAYLAVEYLDLACLVLDQVECFACWVIR